MDFVRTIAVVEKSNNKDQWDCSKLTWLWTLTPKAAEHMTSRDSFPRTLQETSFFLETKRTLLQAKHEDGQQLQTVLNLTFGLLNEIWWTKFEKNAFLTNI